jgi:uncharacterized Zn finger protein
MSYWGSYYPAYVSVAERRAKAEKAASKAKKSGKNFSPIEAYRGAIAKSFWGKAWCDNLEQYSDYANRLPRGRTYVRNGSVIDLQIRDAQVSAHVMGSSLYQIQVSIDRVSAEHWKAICTDCATSIDTLVELLQGKLAKPVMERICRPKTGLFPAPKDIEFSCSCPDSARMCKHVAAVLYGVGARLDKEPELLFKLRHVDAQDLVAQASGKLPSDTRTSKSSKLLADSALSDVFGLEMDGDELLPAAKVKLKPVAQPAPKKTNATAGKLLTAIKTKKAVPKKTQPVTASKPPKKPVTKSPAVKPKPKAVPKVKPKSAAKKAR